MLRGTDDALVAAALRELFGKKLSLSELLNPDLLYAERWVPYKQEIAVMVVRLAVGDCKVWSYLAVTAIQKNSICRVVLALARDVLDNVRAECEEVARKAFAFLGNVASSLFGVDLSDTSSGQVTLN